MQPMPRRFQVGHRYKRPRSMNLSLSVDEIDQQELILIAINIMDCSKSLHVCILTSKLNCIYQVVLHLCIVLVFFF